MKKRSIMDGVLFAFSAAAISAPAWWGLRGVFSADFALRAVLLGAHLGYLIWLCRGASRRVGNLTLAAANLLFAAVIALQPLTPEALAATLVGVVALNRTLLFHSRIAAVLLDGLLAVAGLMFASFLTARGAGIAVALWGFFLPQSLVVMIPRVAGAGWDRAPDESPEFFSRAHRQAHSALRRLARTGRTGL